MNAKYIQKNHTSVEGSARAAEFDFVFHEVPAKVDFSASSNFLHVLSFLPDRRNF
jgi:hypothetical protein